MTLVTTTPFAMTRQVAKLLWGQILKDSELYGQEDAARFAVLLEELGYDFDGEAFMAYEARHLKAVANGTAVNDVA